MRAGLKALSLVVGSYAGTVVAAGMATALVVAVLSPHSCSAYERALVVSWLTIAFVFGVGFVTTGFLGGPVGLKAAGRMAVMVALGAALLLTYVLVALGLMLAFNC